MCPDKLHHKRRLFYCTWTGTVSTRRHFKDLSSDSYNECLPLSCIEEFSVFFFFCHSIGLKSSLMQINFFVLFNFTLINNNKLFQG